MVRLILFDIDGTLIRTGGAGVHAFGCAFATEFQILNGTERMNFAGRTDTSLVREFFNAHQIEPTPDKYERFFACYVHWLAHFLEQLHGEICPGVHEFLHLATNQRHTPVIGLLTGNIRLGAEIKLRHFNLWEPFVAGGFGDDHEDRAEIARIAAVRGSHQFGRPLVGEEILVIGDTPRDVACAQAIGARSLAVATGGATLAQLRECQPTWAVPDLRNVKVSEVCA